MHRIVFCHIIDVGFQLRVGRRAAADVEAPEVAGDDARAFARSRWGLDLEGAAREMTFDGEVVSTGLGAAALGNPLNAAAWLARTLAARGEPLKAGDVLLAGALGPMVSLQPGNVVRTKVAGIGECSFTYGNA